MPTKLGNQSIGGIHYEQRRNSRKSRKENKNQDIYEKEVIDRGNKYACIAAAVLATVFFVVQIFVGGGMNYGLYAVVFSMPMGGFWYKFLKLHKKHELFVAIGYSAVVLLFSVAHIYNMITTSTIL